ncbi:helix-turn-helix domain-containing protein [Gilvimarinus agarilyticus]|uniref:helix-turn-helix domain-containing protein n=1 Tax=Gilvimarinus sp. 2_MG-2023 TaxID=3062666 RepID=UPI001C09F134|nr:helix-turn-helix domain-containing protein [Gilvimarinus sp. 2_MG-2023]MBU2884959.1 helix-turn-helix domain-containing protein [Gilvimarinus agarilyticus]MDO6569858.1 helix-turn-helix domain-containing protein [Gilvimarinus sp. 2_MG-2023]
MKSLDSTLPTSGEATIAKKASQELSASINTKALSQLVSITDADDITHSISIPVSSLRILIGILTELGQGNSVNLLPIRTELSTQEAADLLNVPRYNLLRLLKEGHIPHDHKDNHRKVKYADLLAYQDKLEANRRSTLSELSELDQKLGLGYE